MKVGDYVRTQFGLRKIVDIKKDECYKPRVKILVFDRYIEDVRHFGYKFYTDEKIIKNSKFSENILDLIHIGDYINGELVTSVDPKEIYVNHEDLILKEDIKSIVTKEQFESMEYKVKE